jgi:hypothetical protein
VVTASSQEESTEDVNWLPKITVKGKKLKKSGLGKQTLSKQAIKKMPGLAEPDVMRAVQMLPGVVASSDFSNKLYVRGGSSDQNLILLDLSLVYNPSHFGGFFSTFNVDAIHDMEFYKGGFPVYFGNRLSSVLDIRQRDGKDGFIHGGLGLSLLSGKAYYEGGIPGKASWIWTYRRTWIDWALARMKDLGITDFELPYYFYDSQGKLKLNLTPRDTLELTGYLGDDFLEFEDVFKTDWGNKVVGANYIHQFKHPLRLHTHLSYSRFGQVMSMLDSTIVMWNKIDDITFKTSADYLLNKDMMLNTGLELNRFDVVFEQTINTFTMDTTYADNTTSNLFAAFADVRLGLLRDLSIRPGLRLYYYPPTRDIGFDPRIDAELQLTPRIDLLGHVGRYTQYLTSISFGMDIEMPTEFWYAVQDEMEPSKANLVSLGTKYKFNRTTTASVEGYYKLFEDLPVLAPPISDPDLNSESADTLRFSDLFQTAEGYAFGFEFMVDKRVGIINGYAGYALGFSILKEYDTLIYFARWDKRHALNMVGNIDWFGEHGLFKKDKFKLTTSVAFNYGSGLPYTRVLGVKHVRANRRDQYINISGDKYGERYPVYSRLDVTPFRATFVFKRFDLTLFYQIINLLDHENVFAYMFDYNEEEGGRVPAEREELNQLPMIPIFIGFEVEF